MIQKSTPSVAGWRQCTAVWHPNAHRNLKTPNIKFMRDAISSFSSDPVLENAKIWLIKVFFKLQYCIYNIIIIFLLLSKALFQTYWRTAICWGWSENLLSQAVVWNTAGIGAQTAVPWHGNLECCLLINKKTQFWILTLHILWLCFFCKINTNFNVKKKAKISS